MAVVSANGVDFTRSAAGLNAGSLNLGAGSQWGGANVVLDATSRLQLDPNASLPAAALNLGGQRVVVGAGAVPDAHATVLAGGLLDAAHQALELTLRSYTSIDFVGEQNWAGRSTPEGAPTRVQRSLTLDTPQLRGLPASDGTAARTDIAAQSLVLRNSTGQSSSAVSPGQGSLSLQALPPLQYGTAGALVVGPGALSLGFEQSTLRSTGDIVLQGAGGLSAQQNLTFSSARLTSTNAATQTLAADAGVLRVQAEPSSRSLGERVGQGAEITLSARQIEQAGRIDLPGGRLALNASGDAMGPADPTDAIRFAPGSTTSVGGYRAQGPTGFAVSGPAGQMDARASNGTIAVLGALDASAVGEGDGGRISLQANGAGGAVVLARSDAQGVLRQGQLRGAAGTASLDRGGQLRVDVTATPDANSSADAWAAAAMAGGLTGSFDVRVRTGNVTFTEDLTVQRLRLFADAGSLSLQGATLDARAPAGGVVQLGALGAVTMDAASSIDARSTRAGAQGGDVLLATGGGRLTLAPGARIDARGDTAADGRIVLRAPRGAGNNSVAVDALPISTLQAGEIDIEALRVYSQVTVGTETRAIAALGATSAITGTGTTRTATLGLATLRADNNSFMAAAPGILNALGVPAAQNPQVHLRAGVEVRAAGDLNLASDWALQAERPGGEAGFLSLRATGNLSFNASLSDGFVSAANNAAVSLSTAGSSGLAWSYRLAAGADLAAADPLAVRDLSRASADSGNLLINAGRMVRTGAGSIEMAAGRDVRLGAAVGATTAGGMAYVAGRRTAALANLQSGLFAGQAARPVFTEHGGRLELSAARDITSGEANQLINNWLWRSGVPSTSGSEIGLYAAASHLAWWAEATRFRQSLGSFAGGSMLANAGRDIVNLQAMVPTSGWADSREIATARIQVVAGGDLQVRAGRDLLGGQFLVAQGEGRLEAGRTMGGVASNAGIKDPVLAQMNDSTWRGLAREGLRIATSFNPTAAPTSNADNRGSVTGYFYNWSPSATLDLRSQSGEAVLLGGIDNSSFGAFANHGLTGAVPYFSVLPARLNMAALGGDLRLLPGGGAAVLFPSVQGDLQLWAGGSLTLGSAQAANLSMADSNPNTWPSANNPLRVAIGTTALPVVVASALAGTQSPEALHAANPEPARIHAGADVSMAANSTLTLATAAQIDAGQDIVNLRVRAQNLTESDVTTITAGRNLQAGALGLIELAGPGALEVSAGRNIDLGASLGIRTTGNQANARLPASGASVRLAAATQGRVDLVAFEAGYLRDAGPGVSPRAAHYREELLGFVRSATGSTALDYAQAWALFQGFPAQAQARLAQRVLAREFGATYLDSAVPTPQQYSQSLREAFERRRAQVLAAGEAALAAGGSLVLPGRESLTGDALQSYLNQIRGLGFAQLDLSAAQTQRLTTRATLQQGWRNAVAASLGRSAFELDTLQAREPGNPLAQAWAAGLAARSGITFERYVQSAVEVELASAARAASAFGRLALPMRQVFFDEGFLAAELGGLGSFTAQPVWPGRAPALAYSGTLDITQSAVLTQRGGGIHLLNPGGGINVGLKDTGNTAGALGVIALGGGDIFGYSRDDFQVNTQRVFIVGQGDMSIWASRGDIDSGRGANTAVAAPPLRARRTNDGIAFEVPATTTGSGLGILADATGRRAGTIGLFPALGEILALDAFIRAPSVLVGSSVRGADNIVSPVRSGAAAAVSAPVLTPPTAPATTASTQQTAAQAAAGRGSEEARPRSSLLTVELLGLGSANEADPCSEEDERNRKCTRRPAR
jgi:filamentous hemagglutinin